jgi:DivIVA domain-containing protein
VTWLFLLLAMSVIAVVAAVVTGRIGGGLDAPVSSLPFRGLPPDGVTPGDLETLRFSPALRGYRMDEVDQVLDRLGVELHRRDAEIAQLSGQLAALQQPFGEPEQTAGAGYQDAYEAAYGPGHAIAPGDGYGAGPGYGHGPESDPEHPSERSDEMGADRSWPRPGSS